MEDVILIWTLVCTHDPSQTKVWFETWFFLKIFDFHDLSQKEWCDLSHTYPWFEPNSHWKKFIFQIDVWFKSGICLIESSLKNLILSFFTYDLRHTQDIDFDQLAQA